MIFFILVIFPHLKSFIKLTLSFSSKFNFLSFSSSLSPSSPFTTSILSFFSFKSVTVHKIIKNNEIFYELAYPHNCSIDRGKIIIYNILLKKITNKIHKAHSKEIRMIKHYYYFYSKKHLLLTSSLDKSIKLWNISSNPISNISNELIINNCFDGNCGGPFCILFIKNDYFIIGGSYGNKKNIWDKNGKLIGHLEKSNLNYGLYVETIYLNNKSYVLLPCRNHTESYDYYNNILRIYKSNNDKYDIKFI